MLTGRVFEDLRKYPKLVGGLSDGGRGQGGRVLRGGAATSTSGPTWPGRNGVWDLGSAEAAELAKLAETTYRDVNIGLANQFARFAATAGIDVYQVIEAANSQPYSHIHRPGIAVGGHCIPVYPRLYLWNDPEATVVRAAREANAAMPAYTVGLLEARLRRPDRRARGGARRRLPRRGEGDGVLRGVRRRRGAANRGAPRRRGARPAVHRRGAGRRSASPPYHLGEPVDAAVVQADHAEYRTLGPQDLPGVRVFIDGRRVSCPERVGRRPLPRHRQGMTPAAAPHIFPSTGDPR